MEWSHILFAVGLTLIAGLSTGIGGFLSFFTKANDSRVLSAALGLSAGVMVYISFVELLPRATLEFASVMTDISAKWWALVAFMGGIGVIALIDRLIPEDENPHEIHSLDELTKPNNHHLKRTGIMLALAITIHNFPEGIATFITALDSIEMAIPVVAAIAIHNIPEGIAVSVPIYQSTGSRRKAILWTIASGLAEPIGAVMAILFLLPFWSPVINAVCLSAVSGIMVYISFDELLPTAESHGHHHLVLGGVILGIFIMALTLLVL